MCQPGLMVSKMEGYRWYYYSRSICAALYGLRESQTELKAE